MKTKERTFPSIDTISKIDILSTPFFVPDNEFAKWLVEYANGRLIVDCGAGSGLLCATIQKNGGKCLGIEPKWTMARKIFWMKYGYDFNILSENSEESIVLGFPPKTVLFVFARPCHSGFPFRTILKTRAQGSESLYIGLEENVEMDLPTIIFKKLSHKGTSHENEIVLSIK